jgi:hypothetical protein
MGVQCEHKVEVLRKISEPKNGGLREKFRVFGERGTNWTHLNLKSYEKLYELQ